MNIRIVRQRAFAAAATAVMSVLAIQAANAAPLSITDTPLFLMGAVKPNLIMAIDDSGSMDTEVLMRGNDGMAWWRAANSDSCTAPIDNTSFSGCVANATGTDDVPGTGLNFNTAGSLNTTWRKFGYLFPNGEGTNIQNKRRLTDAGQSHFAIPPLPQWGWSRSPDYNRAYFDPTTVYSPWPNGGGYTFSNALSTATRYDPVYDGAAPIDLTKEYAGTASVAVGAACDNTGITTAPGADYGFRVYTGMTIPENTCIRPSGGTSWVSVRPGGTCQVGPTNGCQTGTVATATTTVTLTDNTSIGMKYFPATFYLKDPAPASFGYSATPATDGKTPDGTATLYRYEIKPGNFSTPALYNAAIQNFANWFQYYRKRHMALRAGLGTAFLSLQGTRVAGFTINAQSGNPPNTPDVTMLDVDNVANRTALYTNFYYNWTGDQGTPNRRAVANLIRNFYRTNTGAPVTNSCQRNFGMLFTDGYAFPPATGDGINGVAGNADGSEAAPYKDSTSDTLADAVMNAYKTPLRTGTNFPTGKVIVPSACSATSPDPRLDCNKNLHMNFYAVTLGAQGLQYNADNPVDPYVTPPTWPATFPSAHPSAVDDLWHATINGRGQLLNAASSAELADKLSSVLRSIIERVGSASSAAVNSGSINSDTRLFQASFDSKDWSGKLTGRDVTTTGTLGTEVLATVPAAASRQIVTLTSTGTAVPFLWANLGVPRQNQLDADGNGSSRLDWLRGVQTNEVPGGIFRKRTSLLGDIINSAPAFVGAPAFRYPDTLESKPYSTFRTNNLTRDHMVYVGANDGMLHAFYSDDTASNGVLQERFAFIPGAVFGNLPLLSSPSYSHRYFVDGTPVTGDAFVGGDWRTMLVGGLNKGGQAVFALDVTDPDALTESNATSVFKWQFSDAQDADLGYTYSRPSIVRMNNGVWVAAFGNGYNNTVADGAASTSGNAVLYIVNLETGAQIAKINTGVGTLQDPTASSRPNGLSTPVFVDIDGDSDVDLAYAGDLFGNMWKFDLSSSSSSGWGVANSAPLFTAKDSGGKAQPITSRPNVSRGANGQGLIIVFGTGKYLEVTDTDTTYETATFYGLLDPNKGDATDKIAGRANLTQQTITNEVTTSAGDLRVVSANALGTNSRGWYLDLVSPSGAQGEMQVTDSLIRNGHVVFTTLVPNSDPCEFGGSSWLMEINIFNGARASTTPFDLNNNGLFDDTTTIGTVATPVSGVRTTVGITPKPAPLSGEKCDYLIFPGTSGGTETRCRDPGPRGSGRQSWRQAH